MRQRRWLPRRRARGLDARMIDAERLPFEREFDAVFSNAALHWVRDHDAMLAGVHRALKPGGRFVAEFGGHGNIAAIQVAIRSVLAHRGWETNIHRYYATPAEYSARLRDARLQRERHRSHSPADAAADRHPRVARDIRARHARSYSAAPSASRFFEEVEDLLREEVCDSYGNWTAHYVRLRFRAPSLIPNP